MSTQEIWERGLVWRCVRSLPILWQAITWFPGWLLLIIFADLEVNGKEYLRSDYPRGLVLAGNHESDLDGILMLSGIPLWSHRFPIYYVARARKDYSWNTLWRYVVYQSWFLWLVGAFPLTSFTKNYAISLAMHVQLLRDGHTIGMFPEGAYVPSGRKPAHGGIVYLAETAGAPIIPVRIEGTAAISLRTLFLGRHKIKVTYLPPVNVATLVRDTDGTDRRYTCAAERLLDYLYTDTHVGPTS